MSRACRAATPPPPPRQATQNQPESRCRARGPGCPPVSVCPSQCEPGEEPGTLRLARRRKARGGGGLGAVVANRGAHNKDASRRRVPVRAWSRLPLACAVPCGRRCRGGGGTAVDGGHESRLIFAEAFHPSPGVCDTPFPADWHCSFHHTSRWARAGEPTVADSTTEPIKRRVNAPHGGRRNEARVASSSTSTKLAGSDQTSPIGDTMGETANGKVASPSWLSFWDSVG